MKLLRRPITRGLFLLFVMAVSACKPGSKHNGFPPRSSETLYNLEGSTWVGINDSGERYEVAFRSQENLTTGFTISSPTHTVNGERWWYYEKLVCMLFPDSAGVMRCEVLKDRIVVEDATPFVYRIDYKALIGDAYRGGGVLEENFICGKQEISAGITIEGSNQVAREQFGIWHAFELEYNHQPKAGPSGLGEACYSLPLQYPNCLAEYIFLRKNVLFHMPETNRIKTADDANEQVLTLAHILDAAVRDENPAVTIVKMPKVLKRKSH